MPLKNLPKLDDTQGQRKLSMFFNSLNTKLNVKSVDTDRGHKNKDVTVEFIRPILLPNRP